MISFMHEKHNNQIEWSLFFNVQTWIVIIVWHLFTSCSVFCAIQHKKSIRIDRSRWRNTMWFKFPLETLFGNPFNWRGCLTIHRQQTISSSLILVDKWWRCATNGFNEVWQVSNTCCRHTHYIPLFFSFKLLKSFIVLQWIVLNWTLH